MPDRAAAGTRVLLGLAVAAAYFAAAQMGFRLAFVAEQITTVWAPTGIALAALLLGGIRLWPAIWLGAFVANAGSEAPLWTACVIASGNTLEAVAAAWALRHARDFSATFQRVRDVVAFMMLAAVVCTAISATVGVVTLCAAAVQPWQRFAALWFDWWLGDALGALIVAPAILTMIGRAPSRRDWIRAAASVAAAAFVTHVVFGQLFGLGSHPLEFVVFPVVIAAALTGGPYVTSWVVLVVSAVSIADTVRGAGPFAGPEVHHSLILLQAFMGVLAGTALMLAAAIAEQRTSGQRERDAANVLRQREEMLMLAQRAGGVATFEWDFRNQVAHCSAEFFRIFGLPAGDGVIASADWGSYVHPDDRQRMAAHLARAIEGHEPPAADYRINAADGSTRWLSYAGRIEKTAAGHRMVGTVADISDRKRLEAELRHHAAEVERILESIGEGFVALDREFRYVYVNRAAEQMLGHSRTSLIGRIPWDVFPAEGIGAFRQHLEAAVAAGTTERFEVHVADWNRWYENRVYPSATGVSIFFADVTARVESETALRESRNMLSLAMRGGSMGAWSRNLTTNEVWWSRELEELFELEPGGLNRTEGGYFDFVHENDRSALRRAVDRAIEDRSDYIVEFRFRNTGDAWRWMEGRGRAVYAEDGTPRMLYGIGIDVTARKQAEMALREAKTAAEAANQLKDHFLATLSHELRTPLNAILGYAQMLQTQSIAPDKRQRAIEVIQRNAVAQNQLVEDLLDMSRITTGKLRLEPEPMPVAPVLQEAVEAVRPAADAKGITLELDVDPFAGSVTADATRLQQVFWNLLSNAVKFTSQHGHVVASLRRDGEHLEIAISDTGVGISPEFLPFVFEPFRQADARFDRAHGGLGLGLAISKQLVELHGGIVQVSSGGLGKGATFTVRLPRAGRTAASAGDTPTPRAYARRQKENRSDADPSLAGLNILLVEDQADTLTMFRDALESAGAQVRAMATGAEAVREMEQWRPDLVVTDLGLPGMDGYELLKTIREMAAHRNVPAVAVSAYARPDDRSRALEAGFQAHLAKPIDPRTLVRALAAAVSASG
jgi:PAS domain S-box-containing protein